MSSNASTRSATTMGSMPPSESLLDILVGRALCLAISPPWTPEVNFDSLDLSTATHDELYRWADHLRLASVPTETFHTMLDRMFFIGTECPHLTSASIHALHELRASCKSLCDKVHLWVERDEVQSFFQSIRDDIIVHRHVQYTRARSDKHRLFKRGNALAYECAAHCLECFKFLIENNLFKAHLYDSNGRNYLHAAIEFRNDECLEYLIKNLTPQQIDRTTDVSRDRFQSHPLVQLATMRNQRGFEQVLDRLLGHFNPADLFTDELKLKLCAFVSPEFAERLYAMDLNIGNVTSGTSDTTSWHVAAHENQHGSWFMEWLRGRSGTDPTILDAHGHNALMHAAMGNRVTSIQWLCSHVDPMERRVDPDESSPENTGNALELAARSMNENSPEIFHGILLRMPKSYLEDLDVLPSVFRQICDALVAYRRALTAHSASLEYQLKWDQALQMAKTKCSRLSEFLRRALPCDWDRAQEMKAICEYARDHDLPALVLSICPPPAPKTWFRMLRRRGRARWTGGFGKAETI